MRDTPFPPLRAGLQWRLAGLWRLIRWVPVASWLGGAMAIGAGAALGPLGQSAGGRRPGTGAWWLDLALVALSGVALQGLAAHAFNDREDWRSGTDPASPGALSGGSKAVPRRLLGRAHLTWAGVAGLAAAAGTAGYFTWRAGPGALVLWLIGAWAVVSYSLPPFRLAYRPFLGEWLAAWPAVVAATAGTFYLLAHRLAGPVLAAGAVHGCFCLAWLMQHHLADVPADLAADPVKLTTPAWFYRRRRLSARGGSDEQALLMARLPGMAYFGLAALGAAAASAFPEVGPAFGIPGVLATLGLFLTWRGRQADVAALTCREKQLILLSLLEAASLAIGLAGANVFTPGGAS